MPEPAGSDVAFLPSELEAADVAIVVDVLRASSTIVQALAAGCRTLRCAKSIEAARRLAGPGRVLAGERHCLRPPDFDFGNSPAALAACDLQGREVVLATTNGTPAALTAARHARLVLVGCLLNLDAVVAAVPPGAQVTVVCSGTDARFALEDAYVAGRIVERLAGERSDSARAAVRMARSYPNALEPLRDSADGRVLAATGQDDDIAWCARESVVDLVPRVHPNGAAGRDGTAFIDRYEAMSLP